MPAGNLKALYAKSFGADPSLGQLGVASGASGGSLSNMFNSQYLPDQTGATTGAASVGTAQGQIPQQVTGTNPGWFNQSAVQAAGPGMQGNLTPYLNSFDGLTAGNVTGETQDGLKYNGAGWSNSAGVKFYDPYARYQAQQQAAIDRYTQNSSSDNPESGLTDPGAMQSREDWFKANGLDINKTYGQTDTIDNPFGNKGKDLTNAMYEIDPATGKAVPVQADNRYQPSSWVQQRDTVRDGALFAALASGAGYLMGGSLGGAAGAAGATEAAAATPGFDFAAAYGAPTTPGGTLGTLASSEGGLGALAPTAGEVGGSGFSLGGVGGSSGASLVPAAAEAASPYALSGAGTIGTGSGLAASAAPFTLGTGLSTAVGATPMVTQALTGDGRSIIDKIINSLTGPTGQQAGGTLNNLIRGGASLYSNTQQNNRVDDLVDQTKGLFGQDSAYAQNLRKQLEARDAKAGKASQYGPREVELQAKLAEMASGQTKTLADLIGQQGATQNGQLNAGIGLIGAGADAYNQLGGWGGISDTAGDLWNKISGLWKG